MSVPVPQRTESMPTIKTNQLMPLGKVTAIYSENHTKYINALCGQNSSFVNVSVDGAYSYHWALKGKCAFLLAHEKFHHQIVKLLL
jgi:hypothetical protein